MIKPFLGGDPAFLRDTKNNAVTNTVHAYFYQNCEK